MTHRLPVMQPLWSFASAADIPHLPDAPPCDHMDLAEPVQGWTKGEDGRPHMVFSVPDRSAH